MSDPTRPARGETCNLCGRKYENHLVEAHGRFRERMSNALAAIWEAANGEPTAETLQRIRDLAEMKIEMSYAELLAKRESRLRRERTVGR